jgi:hypothetical protein
MTSRVLGGLQGQSGHPVQGQYRPSEWEQGVGGDNELGLKYDF